MDSIFVILNCMRPFAQSLYSSHIQIVAIHPHIHPPRSQGEILIKNLMEATVLKKDVVREQIMNVKCVH